MCLDDLGFVEVLGIGENAGGRHEPAFEGTVEIDDVEDVIFHEFGILKVRQHSIQDDALIEDFAEGLGEVFEGR